MKEANLHGVAEEPQWKQDWFNMWKQLNKDKYKHWDDITPEEIKINANKEKDKRIKASRDFKTEYYKSVWWAYISAKNKQDNNYTCERCGDKDGTKEAHHKRYTNIGTHAELEDLECLCVPCHENHKH